VQLSAQLLSQAGVRFIQVMHAVAEEPTQYSDLLVAAGNLLQTCCTHLRGQLSILWRNGQRQPPLQLLQQGGGAALLQGLTLAAHANALKLSASSGQHSLMPAGELLEMLWAGTM
jgi:hypothetical protein